MAKKEVYNMVARRSLDGIDGQFKQGETFQVTRKERAEALKRAGVADYAKDAETAKQAAEPAEKKASK